MKDVPFKELRVGGKYRNRKGDKVEIDKEYHEYDCNYPFEDTRGRSYTRSGQYSIVGYSPELDLTHEIIDETESVADTRDDAQLPAKSQDGPPCSPNIDLINHPPHYNRGPMECIDIIEMRLTPEQFVGYLKGQQIKYDYRDGTKGGEDSQLSDAKKKAWYANREVQFLEKAKGAGQ